MRPIISGRALLGLWVAALGVIPSAQAIVRRHDVPDESYIVPASDYPAVVDLLINVPGDCLATLIAPQWLITAAHCVDSLTVSADIRVGSSVYQVAQIDTHSGWNQDTDDLTLIRLSAPVPDVTPIPWNTASDEVGQTVWLVGRGDTSTGDVGGGQPDGNTRAATNTVVGADAFWLRFVFNAPGEPGVTALEGISGDGDSGGPALIQTAQGLRVAGVSSYQEEGGRAVGTYGVEEFYTRVSQYTQWIEERVGPPFMPMMDAGVLVDLGEDAGAVPGLDGAMDVGVDAGVVVLMDGGVQDFGGDFDLGAGPDMEEAPAPEEPGSRVVQGGCGCQSERRAQAAGLGWGWGLIVLLVGVRRQRRSAPG